MTMTLTTMEAWVGISPQGYNYSNFCQPASGTGSAGCGANASGIHGCIAPADVVVADRSNGRWTVSTYTIGAGWQGSDSALVTPQDAIFTTEDTNLYSSWVIGFRYKHGSTASDQIVLSFGEYALRILAGGAWDMNGSSVATYTSSDTATAGVWMHVEASLYIHATNGHIRIKVNGTELNNLDHSGIDTRGTVDAVSSFTLGPSGAAANGTYTDVYAYVDNADFSSFTRATSGLLPVLSTLTPISQGSFMDFDRYELISESQTFIGAGSSANYTYVDDVTCDGPVTELQRSTAGKSDSWVLSGLPANAGDVLEVMSSTTIAVGGNFMTDSHGMVFGGVIYNTSDNGDFAYVSPGAQVQYGARHFTVRPDTSGAWVAADLAAPEIAVTSLGVAATRISLARLLVLHTVIQTAGADGLYTLAQTGVDW